MVKKKARNGNRHIRQWVPIIYIENPVQCILKDVTIPDEMLVLSQKVLGLFRSTYYVVVEAKLFAWIFDTS